MKRPDRIPSPLSDSLHRQLNAYALSACAAGVGVLALTQPAEARIVYTKVHQRIPINTVYPLDLNHDGINDLLVSNKFSHTSTGAPYGVLALGRVGFNYVEGSGQQAFALKRGVRLGVPWNSSPGIMAQASSKRASGDWVDVNNRYLGVKFQINGKYHYGWVRMRVEVIGPHIIAILNGYAFETIPGKSIRAGQTKEADDQVNKNLGPGAFLTNPIAAPQPASLGALAKGAPGLSIQRRKEPVGATDASSS